jgi:hypothetical protein
MARLLSKWIAVSVREHLEDILEVARTFMSGFGLSDSNDQTTNKRNFNTATFLSTYLHLHRFPQSPTMPRVSPQPLPYHLSLTLVDSELFIPI